MTILIIHSYRVWVREKHKGHYCRIPKVTAPFFLNPKSISPLESKNGKLVCLLPGYSSFVTSITILILNSQLIVNENKCLLFWCGLGTEVKFLEAAIVNFHSEVK